HPSGDAVVTLNGPPTDITVSWTFRHTDGDPLAATPRPVLFIDGPIRVVSVSPAVSATDGGDANSGITDTYTVEGDDVDLATVDTVDTVDLTTDIRWGDTEEVTYTAILRLDRPCTDS